MYHMLVTVGEGKLSAVSYSCLWAGWAGVGSGLSGSTPVVETQIRTTRLGSALSTSGTQICAIHCFL